MKIQIDLKSVLCGVIIGVAAMFAMGADDSPSNPVGRYQIASSQNFAVVLDTTTGRAWGANFVSTAQYRNDGNFWDAKDQ
jgi:hypothetical protein